MGLDITAYGGLTRVYLDFDEGGEPIDPETGENPEWPYFIARENPYFPGRMAGLVPDAVYRAERVYDFRAGSYGGYNDWRENLEVMAAALGSLDIFKELIDFSDCEGVIGPIVSAQLCVDFVDYEEIAETFSNSNRIKHEPFESFIDKYRQWMMAFEMAANDGAVRFH